jgi:hypothetical protein
MDMAIQEVQAKRLGLEGLVDPMILDHYQKTRVSV